ncbi:SDR family NAD(P)-dependent oxidoreductase [Rhodoligotrophos ferricapiens]|uniref:SDR family NAD(P)-dependent oxidoreductase n=1 Tax=Rhodoligotrophos ferricapiens TaxID=3069264 RepID=UPI00315D5312
MNRLAGKVALITGAGSGIGAATARRFAAEGARVLLTDIAGDRVRAVAEEIGDQARWLVADHTREEDCLAAVQKAIKAFGALHVLHNNAGVPQQGGVDAISADEFRHVIGANLVGPFLMTKAAIPHLRAVAEAGANASILFTGSIQSLMVRPGFTAYAASKHGIGGLVGSIALEFAPVPIRVNALCPGPIDTPLMREIGRRSGDEEAFLSTFRAGIPMKRLIGLEDVAAAAVFLSSDEAKMITGVMLPIDGGLTAR